MQPIERFSLEAHRGPYEEWPRTSRLVFDGVATSRWLPGYHIGWQFSVGNDYLMILDYDCPYEETYEIVLLSPDLRTKSRASDPPRILTVGAVSMGALQVSGANLYCGHEVLGERRVRLLGCGNKPPHLLIEVRTSRRFGIESLLDVQVEMAVP